MKKKRTVKFSGHVEMMFFEATLSGKGAEIKSGLSKGFYIKNQSITCLKCGMTSHNPNDVREKYCGHCHEFLS